MDSRFFIRNDFDIYKQKNIVFFDIDCTLSSAIDEEIRNQSDEDCIIYAEKLGFIQENFLLFNAFDVAVPQKSSLDLFAYFLKITNSKAICISSWASVSNGQKCIDEIENIFSLISSEFEKDWLVGLTNGCGGDRWASYIKPFTEDIHPTCNHVAFDDGAHEYSNTETTIHVDSMLGLNIYDFINGLRVLGYNEKLENDYLNFSYHLNKKK